MTINTHTAAEVKVFQKELLEAMNIVAAKHGMAAASAGGTLGDILKLKFEFSKIATAKNQSTGETADSVEQAKFNQIAPLYGLTPADYGRTFRSAGRIFKLTGLKIARKSTQRYVVIGTGPEGGRYKFEESVLKQLA